MLAVLLADAAHERACGAGLLQAHKLDGVHLVLGTQRLLVGLVGQRHAPVLGEGARGVRELGALGAQGVAHTVQYMEAVWLSSSSQRMTHWGTYTQVRYHRGGKVIYLRREYSKIHPSKIPQEFEFIWKMLLSNVGFALKSHLHTLTFC